ncbi:MAG: response regulator [Actinomycetota bacterium]|nr:response regulator [Actinomycetota bacterium]
MSEVVTVLCVDDDSANVKLLERILERRPHVRVVTATTGRQAVAAARQHRPALVFLDLTLPDMQGEDVLAELRAEQATAGIPVVVVSGDTDPGRAGRLRESGAAEFLTKPIDIARVLEVVDRVATP